MEKYVYITNPARIKSFLKKIQSAGIPDKLTYDTLKVLGFKSSNDRPLVRIMKALGFAADTGTPTQRWQDYRSKSKAKYVLAEGILEHYAKLYKFYEDAHLRDNEALRDFFGTHTTVSKGTLNYMVATFKALAELADFEKVEAPTPKKPYKKEAPELPSPAQIMKPIEGQGYVININIQLTLPETTNIDTYDAIFKAMKKNLLS